MQVCVTMAPLTPFLTETMYQNLRRCLPADSAPQSIHFREIPEATPPQDGDAQIERSVARMQTVVELGRTLRERQSRPLRTPLRALTVAHADPAFLKDLTGTLAGSAFAPECRCMRAVLDCPLVRSGAPEAYRCEGPH